MAAHGALDVELRLGSAKYMLPQPNSSWALASCGTCLESGDMLGLPNIYWNLLTCTYMGYESCGLT